MNREEIVNSRAYQVTKAALEYYNENQEADLTEAFEAGAEWDKEVIIEKACRWLQKTLYIHIEFNENKDWCKDNPISRVISNHSSVEEFIKDFRESLKS